jgi:hypothetical protein
MWNGAFIAGGCGLARSNSAPTGSQPPRSGLKTCRILRHLPHHLPRRFSNHRLKQRAPRRRKGRSQVGPALDPAPGLIAPGHQRHPQFHAPRQQIKVIAAIRTRRRPRALDRHQLLVKRRLALYRQLVDAVQVQGHHQPHIGAQVIQGIALLRPGLHVVDVQAVAQDRAEQTGRSDPCARPPPVARR